MMRKLSGYMLGLIGLMIYILAVLRLGAALLPQNAIIDMLYYAVAGIIWIFPAMGFIRWWYRPKKANDT